MKKVFAIVLFSVCLLSFSLSSLAARPSDAVFVSGTIPLYLNSYSSNNGFSPTSITLVDLWGQTTTVAGSVDIEKQWAQSGYAILSWELDLPYYFSLPMSSPSYDLSDGYFQLSFNPNISLSRWSSGSNINYYDVGYSLLNADFTNSNGVSVSIPRASSGQYKYSWTAEPPGWETTGTYPGGNLRVKYSVTVAGPNRTALSATSLSAAVAQIKLFVSPNAGVDDGLSRIYYEIYYYTFEQYYDGLLDSQNSFQESLSDKEIAVNESIADQQASQASQEHEEVINGYDNSSGEDANSSLESGLASYEDQESQAHADFDQKMDDYDTPDISSLSAGVTFLSSAITMWWDGLGIFQIGLLVMFALMIFNFISRYRGG